MKRRFHASAAVVALRGSALLAVSSVIAPSPQSSDLGEIPVGSPEG